MNANFSGCRSPLSCQFPLVMANNSGDLNSGDFSLTRLSVALAVMLTGLSPIIGSGAAQPASIDLSDRKKGQVTGLPVPRFVSLKADEVNVRRGPAWDQGVAWVFRRAGLPVEVIAEFDVWRQIRDSEGGTGWVVGTLLSGRRTVLVAPWKQKGQTVELYASESRSAPVSAKLAPGVLGDVRECDGQWCRITAGNIAGYVLQEMAWGVYPGERIE
jgi:SH3-like domain-containing protein